MKRSKPFMMRHTILPVRHQHVLNSQRAFTAPTSPLGVAPPHSLNRDDGGNPDTGRRAFPCKDGLCLCRDILLLFSITLAVGWFVGGMVAKLFVNLVTQ